MKKLSLSIDTLRVESFQTAGILRARGTVRGNVYPDTVFDCGPVVSENTCLNTCGNGDECTNGYTLWNGCTNNYKLCG